MTRKQKKGPKRDSSVGNPLVKGIPSKHLKAIALKQNASDTQVYFAWDDVKELRENCLRLLISVAECHKMAKEPAVLANSELVAKLNPLYRQLKNDIAQYEGAVSVIHALHAGRTGAAKDEEEHFEAFEIAEQYTRWTNDFTSMVLPIAGEIIALYAKAIPADEGVKLAVDLEG